MEAAAIVDALVAGIKEEDPAHLHTAHSKRQRSGIEDYPRPWLDINTTYSDCDRVESRLRDDLLRGGHQPFFLIEAKYENEGVGVDCLARQAYAALLLGSRGHVFGNRPVWLFDPGWEQALDSPGTRVMQGMASLLRVRNLSGLLPDLRSPLTARTEGGRTMLRFVESPRSRVTVEMGIGARRAWWFDTTAGVSHDAGSFPEGGRNDLVSPDRGGPWLLVVDEAALGLPPP
jgi:hypothetical protein